MRLKKILLFLLLFVLFFLSITSNAQDKNDPVFVLDIHVKNGSKALHDYMIYLGNKEDSVAIKKSKEVYVTLKRNKMYSFTFHKEGYDDKALIVNTNLPSTVNSDELFIISFDMELNASSSGKRHLANDMCVEYDKKVDDFNLCSNY
jgi:hypothetical protein